MATGMFSGVPSPNRSVLGAKQLQRPADPYLRQQYPEVYGALGGFMGMAPDEMSGSIFDPNTARVRAGAEYGFPVGTALQVAPLAPMLATGAKATARALGPTAVGMGERYLQSKGLMPGVVEGESAGLLGGPIKPQAPVSELGFYSATEQAALNLPRKSGTGESFLNDLMKGQDVKKDELSWMGLDDYLKGKPNVTRQEVQDFISNNRVDVQERQLGGVLSPEMQTTRDALADKYKGLIDNIADAKSQYDEGIISYAELRNTVQNNRAQIEELDIHRRIDEIDKTIPPTKYQQYQLPGGENYREILLTLPEKAPAMYPNFETYFKAKYSDYADSSNPAYAMAQRDAKRNWDAMGGKIEIDDFSGNRVGLSTGNYTSSHFNEPNILAHMRVNDRVDADGKKMLLIEEIQSDWHQAGREKGYNTAEKRVAEQKKLDDLIVERQQLGERQKQLEELASPYTSQGKDAPTNILDEWNSVSNRLQRLQTEQNRLGRTTGEGVPDAPFKDTWHQLALKRALKYAADNGYDRVGLTTGRQQVERYSDQLRQNVSQIEFQTGTKLSPSEASELQALRNKPHSEMRGNDRARMNYLSDNEGMFVKPNETRINAFNGSRPAFSGTVANGKFLDGPAQGKTVEEVLGSSIAKQIAEKPSGTILGENLSVGGEGMKAYYDEIYPAFLAKQGKKYNAKTGETTIRTGGSPYVDYVVGRGNFNDHTVIGIHPNGSTEIINQNANSIVEAQQLANRYKEKHLGQGENIRYIDISPEMRGSVKKGQPLFTAAPIGGIGLGAGTQDNEMPDAVRQYMADPRYSDPFADTTR